MRFGLFTLVLLLVIALTACGAEIVSQDATAEAARDAVEITDASPDMFPPDLAPSCATNGQTCRTGANPCTSCSTCEQFIFRLPDAGSLDFRVPSQGRCVDNTATWGLDACTLTGWAWGFQPGDVCAGFQGEPTVIPSRMLRAQDCVRLRSETLPDARSGEDVTHCWYSDMTEAVIGYPSTRPVCPERLGFAGTRRYLCGLGCAACPSGEVCMFSSEVYPTGVCVPRTNIAMAVSMPCKTENPRTACPRGSACFLPVRHDAGGIPDRQRWGVCMAPNECNIIANGLRDGYLCDTTLTQ